MHIWNGCNVLNIVGNPMKAINVNLSFLSFGWKVVEWTPQDWKNFWIYFWGQDQKLWNGPPRLEKFFNFISEFRIKSCGMDPPDWKKFLTLFLSSESKVVEWTPHADIWWKFWKIYFSMYCPMMHANLP